MTDFLRTYQRVLLLIVSTACFVSASAQPNNQSICSSLESKDCRVVNSKNADYLARCPGFGGYKLIVTEGDLRQNVTVVAPNGNKSSLDLWTVISGGFSHLGPKAEWRITRRNGRRIPVALIVRLTASEDATNPEKQNSYLAVSKITEEEVCVIAKISPGPSANEDARRAADEASGKPCLILKK